MSAFSSERYRQMYARFMGPVSTEINTLIGGDSGFTAGPTLRARVHRVRESDLVSGGPLRVGDMRLIVPVTTEQAESELPRLTQKDRLEIDGHVYSVVQWDNQTRRVEGKLIAVEAIVRG